jgi:peptide methionine sulfoxide reductase MsrB
VIREKGTEAPNTGEFNKHKEKGVYTCAACSTPLVIIYNLSIRQKQNSTLVVDGQLTSMQFVL